MTKGNRGWSGPHPKGADAPTFKHGLSGSRVYNNWAAMKGRCLNPRANHYDCYGGRGITVTKRWLRFENFLADMGIPGPGLTLERKNNNAGYSKQNCRWATRKEQSQNMRSTVLIRAFGKTKTFSEWLTDPRCRVNPSTFRTRKARGWSDQEALTADPRDWIRTRTTRRLRAKTRSQ